MVIRFHCERCDGEVEYLYQAMHGSTDWPEWRELAEKSARAHHHDTCPPRRGQYRQALGLALRVKRRDE